jgi:Glycosyltransferase family 87
VQLAALLAAGAAIRLILIAVTPGEYYDIHAIARVGAAFLDAPLHLYRLDVNPGSYQGSPTYPWPYLPGFAPIAGLLSWLSRRLSVSVSHLDRTFMGAVDLAVAWVVQWLLGRQGRPHRERLIAAALIALGPAFIAVSAVHGQIDALAWLPAVAAVGIWTHPGGRRRALVCGLLIGIGIAIKTTPGLVLIALAPSARDRRELGTLLLAATVVPLLAVLPFAVVAPHGLSAIVDYRGFAGRAGLTVLLQPRLALHDLTGPFVAYDATTRFLLDHANLVLAAVLIPVAAIAWKRRLDPATMMVALLLAFYVAGPAILPQYWLWIVPFLLLSRRFLAAAVYQLALLPLLVATYAFLQEPDQPQRHLSSPLVLYGYVPILWIVTLGMTLYLIVILARPIHPRVAAR